MLATPQARSRRHEIDQRLNPGYRQAEPARLLADAYALAMTVADGAESDRLKRDCLDVAINIEEYLLDTLSEVRISRGDVEDRFERLRERYTGWPEEISGESWDRLAASPTLRDIGDVVCGGGDYWEAIHVALEDEFRIAPEPPQVDSPRTLYFAMDRMDWADLSAFARSLKGTEAETLSVVLERIRERTADRFAMVVWSVQDVLDAAARAREIDIPFGDEATWEQAGVDREWVEDIMDTGNSAMSDRMTEVGWEVLEDIISSSSLPPAPST